MRTATQAARERAIPPSPSTRREQPDRCVPTKLQGSAGPSRIARPISAPAAPARLLAETSHDLRQPIQAIGLWVELLQSQSQDAGVRAILERLHQTAQGLEGIIDSLLDISRLDMGAVNASPVDFPIGIVQDRLAATFGPAAQSRGLDFRMRRSDAVVRSDPALVERILGNFVSNAIRYCNAGGILLGCRTRGDELSVEVWDTGPGVPRARLADIFEEFVQLHPAPRDRKRGFGLGLSIARRLASLLGHEITVASRIGRGSCFRLRLPFGRQAARCERACASDGDRNCALAGSFVVFIDDEQELREAMAMLLARWGCHAIVAASAGEAIERLASHLRAPDVIICDYRLGDGESGLEAVASMRAALDHPIDAIILSGERTALTDQALARSGIPVLRKPAHPDVIRRHVAQCCRSSNRASGVRDARSLGVES